jgi:hypothetical protein
MKNQVFQTGNTFDTQSVSVGHARKVWRRIEEQLPGGFLIKNISDFVSAGLIRSGMAIVKDATSGADEKDIKVLTDAQLLAGIAAEGGIDSLGIIGFLQEDVPVTSADTLATGNVIVKGEIYGYMLGDTQEDAATISAAVKGMAQKNGLNIRVID